MAPARVLDRDRAALVVVDVQEAFRPAVRDFDEVAAGAAALVRGARILGIPVVVSEQYPKGLGATVPELAEHLDGIEPLAKVRFSAAAADGFDLGARPGPDLRDRVARVRVADRPRPARPAASRCTWRATPSAPGPRPTASSGCTRWRAPGRSLTSVETALFELLGAAGTDEFKQVQGLVK